MSRRLLVFVFLGLLIMPIICLAEKIDIKLIPGIEPVLIDSTQSRFEYDIKLTNETNEEVTFDLWLVLKKEGKTVWPLTGSVSITLQANESIRRTRIQEICGLLEEGRYWFVANVGDYPENRWDNDALKIRVADKSRTGKWLSFGESYMGNYEAIGPDSVYFRPSPFCPSTDLFMSLPETQAVVISLFDTDGQFVHQVFSGIVQNKPGLLQLALSTEKRRSGVYFLRLQFEDTTLWTKMVIIK